MAATTKERVRPPADSAALETSQEQGLHKDLSVIAAGLPAFHKGLRTHETAVPSREYDVPNAADLSGAISAFFGQLEAWRRTNDMSAPATTTSLDDAKGLVENGDALRIAMLRACVKTSDPGLRETLRDAADLVGVATYRSAERGQAPVASGAAKKRTATTRPAAAKARSSVKR